MSKTVLITGASTGFGRDTAETLARAGHTVFASMRNPQAQNRDHAQALRQQGIEVVELDVGSDASVEAAVNEVLARARRIDVLVNNAGIASAGLTDSLRYEVSQLGIDVVLLQPSAYPTPMYSNVQLPADADRTTAYGAIGEIPGAMFKHFMTTFQAPGAPNPHEVAEAIAKLVAQPKGSRPARTVVGAAFGADVVNQQTAPVQAGVVEALGLGHLAKVA